MNERDDLEELTRDEFVRVCASMGYCPAEFARQYMPALDKLCSNDLVQCYRAFELRKSAAEHRNAMSTYYDGSNGRYRTTKNYGTEEY